MKNELIKIDKADFVAKFDPVAMITTHRHIKTTAQAIAADKNGVSFYAKHLGEDSVMAVIELHLVALTQAVNVGQSLTKYQIKEIAGEILITFYFLSIVEISHVFRRAKLGEFGKFYGVLNMPDVLGWFTNYTNERCAAYMDKNDAKDEQNKRGTYIENGELFKSNTFSAEQLGALNKVKNEIGKSGFNEKEYQEHKKNYEKNKNN